MCSVLPNRLLSLTYDSSFICRKEILIFGQQIAKNFLERKDMCEEEDQSMKRSNLFLGVIGVLMLVLASWTVIAQIPQDDEIVRLGKDHVLAGVTLKPGTYLIVHKELGDREGQEPCTFVYRGNVPSEKNLAAKAICRRSDGPAVGQFTIVSTRQPDGTLTVRTLQFPGSTDVHNFE